MEKARRFEDLESFQKARELCKDIYKVTNVHPFVDDYRFVQQIRAAAGPIMDNIAEGFERNGKKEFVNFLSIAKGSCGEVRSQILRASDVGFIDYDTTERLYKNCENISKMLYSLMNSLRASDHPEYKFTE